MGNPSFFDMPEAELAIEVKARVACAEIAYEAKLALAEARGEQCTR